MVVSKKCCWNFFRNCRKRGGLKTSYLMRFCETEDAKTPEIKPISGVSYIPFSSVKFRDIPIYEKDSKSGSLHGLVGSNPTASAKKKRDGIVRYHLSFCYCGGIRKGREENVPVARF